MACCDDTPGQKERALGNEARQNVSGGNDRGQAVQVVPVVLQLPIQVASRW